MERSIKLVSGKKLFTGLLLAVSTMALSNGSAVAYPNGPDNYVTDIAPYCAACHSSVDARRQMPEKESRFTEHWSIRGKHLRMINKSPRYRDLSVDDKKQLIRDVITIDKNTTISLEVPKTAKAGEIITIKAIATGGGGPVIGVALVDNDMRFQSRSIASAGWYIEATPDVKGPPVPKGEEENIDWKGRAKKWGVEGDEWKKKKKTWKKWKDYQTTWTDKRLNTLDANLNYVTIYGVNSDPRNNKFPTSEVTWKVRTPMKTGEYSMAAVIFYGTEKASPLGRIKKNGHNEPRGGFGGGSGRIKFSILAKIDIK